MKRKKVTAVSFSCIAGGCPAVFETNRNTYLIIGIKADPSDKRLVGKIGPNEVLVEVPAELVRNIVLK